MGNRDRRLWSAVLAAERELAQRRSAFAHEAESRTEILAAALRGYPQEQRAALEYLRRLGSPDIAALLDPLLDLCGSHRLGLAARQAIAPAVWSNRLPELPGKIQARLQDGDADEFRDLSALLAHAQAWAPLNALVEQALASDDPEIREVGQELAGSYPEIPAGDPP